MLERPNLLQQNHIRLLLLEPHERTLAMSAADTVEIKSNDLHQTSLTQA